MATRVFLFALIGGIVLGGALLAAVVMAFMRPQATRPSPACTKGDDTERRLADVLALVPLSPAEERGTVDDRGANSSLPITLGHRLLRWRNHNSAKKVSESGEEDKGNTTLVEFLRRRAMESLLALPVPKEGSLLHTAAERGQRQALQDLLEAGAALEEKDASGATALMRAAGAGRADNVKSLLAAGAKVFARDSENATALHRAAQAEDGAGCVEALFTVGGRPLLTAVDSRGRTALHWAAAAGHAGTVRLLAGKGADPRARDTLGTTPLLLAASEGRADAVRELLRLGADVNARDKWQATALHWAAGGGHASALRALLEAPGADVEARDGEEATPLHRVAKGGKGAVEAAKVLLKAGARPDARNLAGQTPLDLCVALKADCASLQELQVSDVISPPPVATVFPS